VAEERHVQVIRRLECQGFPAQVPQGHPPQDGLTLPAQGMDLSGYGRFLLQRPTQRATLSRKDILRTLRSSYTGFYPQSLTLTAVEWIRHK